MKLTKILSALAIVALFSTTLYAQAKKTATKTKPVSHVSAASMANGKVVYGKICITCHQVDGLGVPNMNPPLSKTSFVLSDKVKLAGIVIKGFNESVEIDGNTYSNVMPSQDFLKDQEIADVLTYVRNSFGNKASAVTLADVKKARAAKK